MLIPSTLSLKKKVKKKKEIYAKNSGVANSTFLPFCSMTTTVMSSPSLYLSERLLTRSLATYEI